MLQAGDRVWGRRSSRGSWPGSCWAPARPIDRLQQYLNLPFNFQMERSAFHSAAWLRALPGLQGYGVCTAGRMRSGGPRARTQLPGMRLLGAGRERSAGAAEPGVAEPRMPGCLPAGPFQCTGRLCEPESPPAPHQLGENESSGGFAPSPCNACEGRRSTGGLQPPSSTHVSPGLSGRSQSPASCAARGVCCRFGGPIPTHLQEEFASPKLGGGKKSSPGSSPRTPLHNSLRPT